MHLPKNKLAPFLRYRQLRLHSHSMHLPKCSFVFVTYNRCPNADHQLNPLTWAVQSLMANKGYQPDEIVIVDDCSDDHTAENAAELAAHYPGRIVYHRNAVHQDLSASRNTGMILSRNPLVIMGDDDCLYSEYFLPGSVLTYQLLRKTTPHLALINLNVYEKSTYPMVTKPLSEIGKTDFLQMRFSQHFNVFPQEYLEGNHWLDKRLNLLRPFPIGICKGVNLSDKALVLKAGGYPDLSMWKFGYSEHLELSKRLQACGYGMFHQPDPKIFAIHLHYGAAPSRLYDKRCLRKMIKGPDKPLSELVAFAEKKRYGTGVRCSVHDFHLTEIGTLFSFYLKISTALGIAFALREYEQFVLQNRTLSTAIQEKIGSMNTRKELWQQALLSGVAASAMQTGEDYGHVLSQINAQAACH